MLRRLLPTLCLLAPCLFVLASPALAGKRPPYTYARVGAAADVVRATTPGVVLMGGSTDVDAAFQWMCGLGGNGDFLIIRATGTDAYNPYILDLCPSANSVATLIIPDLAAANTPAVAAIIAKAEMVWIAGGDQSNYINFWKGTPVQSTLNARIAAGVPVGGTSAGLNVLTQFVYTAQGSQGATSSQSMADPFNRYMSFDRDFSTVPVMQGIIGDPHFAARDRMGRDVAFLCRVAANGWSAAPRGIAVDEMTALLVDVNGQATVVGTGNVYFLQAPGMPQQCTAKKPLTYLNIAVGRISAGNSFHVPTWQRTGGAGYNVSVTAGVLTSTQVGGSAY
jgi:cyanophycinase